MKKLLALLLALTMMVCLAACGGDAPAEGTSSTTTTTTAEDTTTTTTVADGTTTDSQPSDTTGGPTITDGSTTAKPTTTANPTTTGTGGGAEDGKSFRLLAMGDGFAVDAMEKHLYDMLKGAGYTQIQLGILYADKSTVDTHYDAVKNNKAVYEFRVNTNGKWQKTAKVAPKTAFSSREWDYVVLQQSAADSGADGAFGNLSKFTAAVQGACPNAAIYWHMTWAFQQGSKQEGFQQYYNNQQLMFQSIVSTTLKRVMPDQNVMGLLPTGTAIQNLRTSTLKDTLNSDGKHLVDTYGDYAAALTWFCCLTQSAPADTTYRPSSLSAHYDEIVEAVENALSVPNQITPAAKGDGVERSISILAVGNSFSVDAMRHHLYPMLQSAGYQNIRLGILYIGGASIDTHYDNLRLDRGKYQYQENVNGTWTYTENYKASTAFALTDWDIVTVQQVSNDSGRGPSYENLPALMELLKPQIGDAKIYWHMTWAYQQDSTHSGFANYNKDQMRMYRGIVSATKNKIVNNTDFVGIIPSGTSIQNLRTSGLGDTLTADGYHLSDTYGDYTAALTWFSMFSGRPATSMSYRPATISDYFDEIAESVDNALKTPFAVTKCK